MLNASLAGLLMVSAADDFKGAAVEAVVSPFVH